MSMLFRVPTSPFFLIPLLLVLGLGQLKAQITSPSSDWQGSTQYSGTTQQDPIFVFFAGKPVTLTATLPDSLLPATFTWYWYNREARPDTLNKRFEVLSVDSSNTVSTLTGLQAGGYRVAIVPDTLPDTTIVFTAWAMVDTVLLTGIEYQNLCSELYLYITSQPSPLTVLHDVFRYNDLSRANHATLNLGGLYERGITWTASHSLIQMPGISSFDVTVSPPPLHNSTYTATIINPFGRRLQVTSGTIAAIATKAEFDIYPWDPETKAYIKADGDARGEALLSFELESTSMNADSIFWRLHNDPYQVDLGAASILWRDSSLYSPTRISPPDELMVPGKYRVEHVALNWTNGTLCIDSITKSVEVDTSKLDHLGLPNVFTPDGDDINSRFMFRNTEDQAFNEWVRSLKDFRIVIFSRWGRKVYEYNGNVREWQGWDGTVNGRGSVKSSEGVYYYIVEATGWDGKRFRGERYRGFVHLFRGRD